SPHAATSTVRGGTGGSSKRVGRAIATSAAPATPPRRVPCSTRCPTATPSPGTQCSLHTPGPRSHTSHSRTSPECARWTAAAAVRSPASDTHVHRGVLCLVLRAQLPVGNVLVSMCGTVMAPVLGSWCQERERWREVTVAWLPAWACWYLRVPGEVANATEVGMGEA
ncbi:hypothetical protein GUJ93_ZPchr0391g11366, partial [Zizania palustris]